VFSRLIMDRIIFLGTGIDDHIANIIVAQLLFLESVDKKEDIKMYLSTPGGNVMAGLGLYSTMELISPDVSTVVTGMAASMGSVLLSAGAKGKRYALPHSRIMIHQPSGGMQGQSSDMEISLKLIMSLKEELYTILANNTGKTYEEIERDSDRDYWMTAQQALEYGLIDEILTKRK
jgi:ATP-dependent Clp protease protease subunit